MPSCPRARVVGGEEAPWRARCGGAGTRGRGKMGPGKCVGARGEAKRGMEKGFARIWFGGGKGRGGSVFVLGVRLREGRDCGAAARFKGGREVSRVLRGCSVEAWRRLGQRGGAAG